MMVFGNFDKFMGLGGGNINININMDTLFKYVTGYFPTIQAYLIPAGVLFGLLVAWWLWRMHEREQYG